MKPRSMKPPSIQPPGAKSGARQFYTALLALAVPLALQDLLIAALNLIDTIMIGRLGAAELAAVSLGNQVFFVALITFFGIGSGASILMAQYWGKRDVDGVRRTLSGALVLIVVAATPFTLATVLFPEWTMRIFTTDQAVIDFGSQYLRTVGISYLFTGLTIAYSMGVRCTGNARLPFTASAISLVINLVLNWVWIYGNLGAPMLGVRGAALATTIARIVEMFIVIGFIYARREPAAIRPNSFRQLSWPFVRHFLIILAPVIAHETVWSMSTTVHKIIYARMGTDVVAANGIVEPIFRLAFVLFIGIASAGAVLVGNQIGAGRRDLAQDWARRLLTLAPLLGIGIGALVALFSSIAPTFYNVPPGVRLIASHTLIWFVLLMPLKAADLQIIVGVLRAGSDNLFNMALDLGISWLISVPLLYIAGLVLDFGLAGAYLAVGIGDLLLLLIGLQRTLSRRWIHDVAK